MLYVSLEEHMGDLGRRLLTMNANGDPVIVAYDFENALEEIAGLAEGHLPTLVVIDSLAELADLLGVKDQGQASSWAKLMRVVKTIARTTDAAVLILHHMNRGGTYRDSTHIGAAVDAVLEMAPDGTDPMKRSVKARGRMPVEPFSFTWSEGSPPQLASDTLPMHVRLLSFVRANPGCSQRRVLNGVVGRDEDIREAIRALLEDGWLDNKGDSGGWKLHIGKQAGHGTGHGWEHGA